MKLMIDSMMSKKRTLRLRCVQLPRSITVGLLLFVRLMMFFITIILSLLEGDCLDEDGFVYRTATGTRHACGV